MYIMHVALGGCLKAPPLRFGVTEDTGGHIAYVLGAAAAQARRPDTTRIDIVTRAFDDPALGAAHARAVEPVDRITRIRRLRGGGGAYLTKDALEAALPELTEAFLAMLRRGTRPDVIHAHFADAAEMALAARDRWGIPVVYTPHSLGIDKRGCGAAGAADPALERRIARERDVIARADAIVTSSRDEAERQVEGYGVEAAGRVHRVSPGVWMAEAPGTASAEALLAPFLRAPAKPLVLAIARPVAKKNLPALVEAFATTPGLRDAANLAVVAGLREGPDSGEAEQRRTIRALLDTVDRHDLWGAAALPKRHEAADIPQLYRLASETGGVFVNPALHEPFGLTLLEAAEHGLPVVATNRGGPRDIVADLRHGRCVDPTDPAALGRAIRDVVGDPAARARMVLGARENLHLYSWPDYAARCEAIYARLSRRPAAAPRRTAARLLVSDIDGTLTGLREGAARIAAWLRRGAMPWAVATGRSLPEARRILARWALPEPDAFVTAVGSEIHVPDAHGRATLDATYAARVSRGWDRAAVTEALRAAGATFQEGVEQRRWKLGLVGDQVEAVRLLRALRNARLGATVIHSHGRLIDVLAPRADKAHAMARLAEMWGLDLADCIACGDSGNDVAMLQVAGAAIVVGNASAEVALPDRPGLVRAVAPHADGVLEGLARLGLASPRAPLAAPRLMHAAQAPEVRS